MNSARYETGGLAPVEAHPAERAEPVHRPSVDACAASTEVDAAAQGQKRRFGKRLQECSLNAAERSEGLFVAGRA